MGEILVSVICTNFNKSRWIGEAIESFLKQKTSFPIEIIIVDDASTDNSKEVIEAYSKKYPDIIRTFYHSTNLGITKTWKTICEKAKGRYIARCDGDDFWTKEDKLEKQIQLLTASPDSRWCNSDFDMVDVEGNILQSRVFENGLLPLSTSFEEMLALKTMTMASTWVVETDLMREVNLELPDHVADDTFNIQLELFKRTSLVTLRESTTVYRINRGSDSKPTSFESIKKRFKGLLETQLAYARKYSDSDFRLISDLLFEKDMNSDLNHFKKDNEIESLSHKVNGLKIVAKEQNDYIESLKFEIEQLNHSIFVKNSELEKVTSEYNLVINSRRWTIPTKFINFFRRKK